MTVPFVPRTGPPWRLRHWLAALAACGLALAACSGGPAEVSGTAITLDDAVLPSGAQLIVQLRNVSTPDPEEEVLATVVIDVGGRALPVAYAVPYDEATIDENDFYVIAASVDVDGTSILATDQPYPVITSDGPTSDVTVVLLPSR